jgi:hypothetical protein
MQAEHRRFLEQRYDVESWFGHSESGGNVKAFAFTGLELGGWSLVRTELRVADHAAVHSMWRHDEAADALLAIDVFECASVPAAHDRLLEILATMQSNELELRVGPAPGDIAFGLRDTMLLFARANVVVHVRNAGRVVVDVDPVARALDARLRELAAEVDPEAKA